MVRTLTKRCYNLNLCFLDLSEDTDFEFPINFNPRTASGIIQLGNFKKHHIRRIRECGLPVVAVDTVEDAWAEGLFSDVIMGVNEEPMKVLIGHLADLGQDVYKRQIPCPVWLRARQQELQRRCA